MADLSETLAKGIIRKITLDGKAYPIGKLGLQELAESERIAKQNLIKERKENIAIARELYADSKMPEAVYYRITQKFTPLQISTETESVEGLTYLLVQLIHKANPDLVESEIREMLNRSDIETVLEDAGLIEKEDEAKKVLDEAAGIVSKDEGEDSETKKAETVVSP